MDDKFDEYQPLDFGLVKYDDLPRPLVLLNFVILVSSDLRTRGARGLLGPRARFVVKLPRVDLPLLPLPAILVDTSDDDSKLT